MFATIALPAFAPDQSVNSNILLTANNVYPAMDGYRPVKALYTISDALPDMFYGGASAIAANGDAYLLAGTTTGLYKMETAGTWTTLDTGLSTATRWRFEQFGDYAIGVNGSTTYEIDLAAGTAAALAGAPTATSIAVVGDYVVVGQANSDQSMVRWSAFRDHTAWVNGTDQAGEQPMQTGGAVEYVCGGEYGVILQRSRIVRMTRTGDSTAPFQFDEISANYGCAHGSTVAQAGRTIFFLSDRGFMALDDGQVLKPIGSEKVDRTFSESIGRADYERIFAAVDPENKLVFWGIPGTPGTLWIYNFELDKWTTAELSFTGYTPGYTTSISLETLAATYTDLDAMTISLDDPRWSGGSPRLYFFGPNSRAGTLAGDNLKATFDLGFTQFTQYRRARIRGLRVIGDPVSGVTMTLDARARLGDAENVSSALSMGTSGKIPVRAAGRFVSCHMEIAASTDWSYIQGLDFEYDQGGTR